MKLTGTHALAAVAGAVGSGALAGLAFGSTWLGMGVAAAVGALVVVAILLLGQSLLAGLKSKPYQP